MNRESTPLRCICRGDYLKTVFSYDLPPVGETQFDLSTEYNRDVLRCDLCGHFVTHHDMDVSSLYTSQYVSSTYGDDGLRSAYDRIMGLDPITSDNVARVQNLISYTEVSGFGVGKTLLDVGSGLCVFPSAMKNAGWDCTVVDPDSRAVAHAQDVVGVKAVCGDYMEIEGLGEFDVVTFNKVLEHVKDPVNMLSRASEHLKSKGFVYIEVPDGEAAVSDGPGREEFFIEHWHVFSPTSLAALVSRAGFSLNIMESLIEPSGKYTLRAFATKNVV